MNFDLEQSKEILERTPYILQAFLKNISNDWAESNSNGDSWSPYDILGHLIHGEKTDWIPRIQIILDFGTSQSFIPFDRKAQFKESSGKSLNQLIEEFKSLRKGNLQKLNDLKLGQEDLNKKGLHPDLGEVKLSQLIATWAVHDLSHISQIAKVMANQYKVEVGPWIEYLGILK